MHIKFCVGSEIEACGDSCQPGGVLPHVVEFGDFRGGVAQEICYQSRRQRPDRTVRLADTVHQIRGECVPLWHNKDKSDKPLRRNGLTVCPYSFSTKNTP